MVEQAVKTTSTLSVPVNESNQCNIQLVANSFVDEAGVPTARLNTGDQYQHFIRQYPAERCRLQTSIGSASYVPGDWPQRILKETVTFKNSCEGRTRFPISGGLTVENRGKTFDENGRNIRVRLETDSQGNITADRPFWGSFVVSYDTTFKLIEFLYDVFEVEQTAGQNSTILHVLPGTVFTFCANGCASCYEVPPIEYPQERDAVEIYRKESCYVGTRDDGLYEEPPGWPTTTWPDGTPDTDDPNWHTFRRVHEIGYLTSTGTTRIDRFTVEIYRPHVFSGSYEPEIETKVADITSLQGRGFTSSQIQSALNEFGL